MALIDNLVSYYKLDENAANTTVEDAHAANDGTASTNTSNLTTAGKINTALNFNGTNEYVTIDGAIPTDVEVYSISTWVKTTSGSNDTIFSLGNSASDNQLQVLELGASGNNLAFVSRDNAGGGVTTIATGEDISDGVWYHILIVVGKTSESVEIFLDGVSVASGSLDTGNYTINQLTIAANRRTSVANHLEGDIDEFGIWNEILDGTDATNLYNSGNGLAYPFTAPPPSYILERSAGRLQLGEGIWGKRKNKLFKKQTAEGEVRVETASGTSTQIIETNTSYNSSTTEIEILNGTYANMITQTHKSNTGKVVIMAQAPVLVKTIDGDVTMRLTKSGVEIPGSENVNIWSSGDGAVNVALIAFTDVEIGKTRTYGLQWKEGDAGLDFTAGGLFGAYNIFVQDIQ